MLKDLINAVPTSRGMNLCQDQHSCRDDPRAALQALHLGLGPTLVLIPDLVLPSWLVSSVNLCINMFDLEIIHARI